jgi:acetyl-CoA carboxylase carboxyl transferase beta subunit
MRISKSLFLRPKNSLEGQAEGITSKKEKKNSKICPDCGNKVSNKEIISKEYTCPLCGYHFKMPARARLLSFSDKGSFSERDKSLCSDNILAFPEYDEKLEACKKASGENESVVTGTLSVMGVKCAAFAMEPNFMMGSMGRVTGEKITRLFEHAAKQNLPVIGFALSGGARVHEGILSLMQMAKTSGAVGRHSEKGLLYICVLQNPTTGGVTASFAMEADIILAEPGALIGFAGPRVIEQTIRQKLPPGFQTAELVLEKGFIDRIVKRSDLKKEIITLLKMHQKGGEPINDCV